MTSDRVAPTVLFMVNADWCADCWISHFKVYQYRFISYYYTFGKVNGLGLGLGLVVSGLGLARFFWSRSRSHTLWSRSWSRSHGSWSHLTSLSSWIICAGLQMHLRASWTSLLGPFFFCVPHSRDARYTGVTNTAVLLFYQLQRHSK